MAKVSNIEAFDIGEDVLRVTGKVDGVDVEAFGWVSATANHYRSGDYAADGHLKESAESQQMSTAQVRNYCRQLLLEVAPARPTRVL